MMRFVRRPAWRYFPQPDRPTAPLRALIDAMADLGPWLEEEWWALPAPRDTRLITAALQARLTPTAGPTDDLGLTPGWNLETREHYPGMPFLYGEGDEALQSVRPDAVHVDADGRLTIVEIEGGGARINYFGMKDIVEALLLPRIDRVAIVVPFEAHHTKPYSYYCNLVASMYAQQVVQPHIDGLLVLGY